ncbi:MAG: hypothetical protein CVU11_07890 [Bacteroidetes bacterium HGW-Bacteroidetes-6]|nr:MAG: hypothetical protein CVU11_07890 [Bacteroidetes bacterium HGW-Bacteroidetes-6]
MKIALIILIALLFSFCKTNERTDTIDQKQVYCNNSGDSIVLFRLNDSLMQTIFYNNNGDIFDTTMQIVNDFDLRMHDDTIQFLKFHYGGLERYGDSLMICEFSNMEFLAQYIRLDSMYNRPFFRCY